MVRILHTHHHPVVAVVVTINIVNHHQVVEAIMAVTTVTIPVVAKTTINHKIKAVIRLMAVEVLEIVAAVIIIAVMVMEVEVEVEAVEAIAVIVLVEAMVEVF